MTRKLRKVLAAGAVLTLLVAGAPTAGGNPAQEVVDWPNLPYYAYRYDNGQAFFYIPTNGDTFGEYGEIGGKQTAFTTFDPRTAEQLGQFLSVEAIWESKCPREDTQKVKMTREVYLPGTPSKLLVNIQPYVQDPAYHDNNSPFAWAEVRINGTEVARINHASPLSTWQKIDATAQASAVKFGLNKIQIVAKKAETKKKWDFCWNKGKPTFGVEAEIYGELTSDMSMTIPGSGSGTYVDFTATISNLGPTTAVSTSSTGGQFSFSTHPETSADVTKFEMTTGDSGVTCQTVDTGDGFSGTCDLPFMPPGTSVTVVVHIEWTGTCPGDLFIPTSRNAVSRWTDPNPSNNQSPAGAGIRCAF